MTEAQLSTSNQQNPDKRERSTRFRVQTQKRIQINKTHSLPRNKAEVLKIITIGLFGARRYRDIILTASLNNFYNALMIANLLQKRVERLALIINLEKITFTQYAHQTSKGQQKQYSIFVIKLTREPTAEDKKSQGYNEGTDKIQNPLTEIWKNRRDPNRRFNNRGGRSGRGRGGRGNFGSERRNRDFNNDRNDRTDRNQRNYRNDRNDRNERNDRNDGRNRNQTKRYERDDRNDRRPQRQDRNRGENRYQQNDRRGGYNNNSDRNNDRQRQNQYQQRYRQDKNERIEDDNQYHRGERKTRGTRVAGHQYRKEHLNRDKTENNRKEDRGQRDPRKNRYSSDQD